MTKEEMRKEINFPVLSDRIFNFTPITDGSFTNPTEGNWIFCLVHIKGIMMYGLYKWQKENNPKNITAYCYVNINANCGSVRYVEYPHFQDENIILICDEKTKDFVINTKE